MTDIKKFTMKRGREPAGWPHIREGTGARPQEPGKGYFCGGFLYTARPSPACRRALHPAAPGEWEEKLRAESFGPRAAGQVGFRHIAVDFSPIAVDFSPIAVDFSPIAVDFSQRTEVPAHDNGLQPHYTMWLKPREKWKPATRQLKQTAMKTEATSCELLALCDFAPWREKDSLRLCAFAPLREIDLTTKHPQPKNLRLAA